MLDKTIFHRMLQEEFRMHTEMFGRYRFAAFPVFIFLMSTLGFLLLASTDVALQPIIFGLHLFVVFFGLQTGSIAFIGTDAMRNVLGDTTYLIYSARTLPISQKRLLGIFLLKDLLYYAAVFLLPITLGLLPAVLGGSSYTLSLSMLALLWLTLSAMFMFGVGVSMILISLSTTVPYGKPLVLAGLVGSLAAYLNGVSVGIFTPYHLFTSPTITAAVTGLVPLIASLLIAGYVFNPSVEREARTFTDHYTSYRERLPNTGSPLVAKMLLDITRSSGGVGKVFFSAALILGVTWFLMQLATDIVGIDSSSALAYGSLLSLTAFTTYNWITQNDDANEYLFYPLDVPDIMEAKRTIFALLTVPVGVVFYGGVVIWQGSSLVTALVGAITYMGLSVYLLGLTVYLAGFSPNEFLFDTVLFMLFTVSIAAALVPILIVAFLFGPLTSLVATSALLTGVTIYTLLLGIIGSVLYSRAGPKWTAHFKKQ